MLQRRTLNGHAIRPWLHTALEIVDGSATTGVCVARTVRLWDVCAIRKRTQSLSNWFTGATADETAAVVSCHALLPKEGIVIIQGALCEMHDIVSNTLLKSDSVV